MAKMKPAHFRLRLGVSACLLGRPTRYDGGHKLDAVLRDALAERFELVPICPEAEAGLGVPREPMRLEGDPEHPRLIARQTRRDLTDVLESWARRRVAALETERLAGFVLKARSPSCGVHCGGETQFTGLFARAVMERFPHLPVEDDERLHDDAARAEFIRRVISTSSERQSAR